MVSNIEVAHFMSERLYESLIRSSLSRINFGSPPAWTRAASNSDSP